MALSPTQQVLERIGKSQNLLITCDKDLNGDSIGSVFALFFILKKLGKNVSLALNDAPPAKYKFLPCPEFSVKKCGGSGELILSIKNPVKEIYYEKTDAGRLKLHLAPNDCVLRRDDISFEDAPPKFDSIIIVNSPDLESVGDVFTESPETFRETPILNIDWKPSNENFGEINLVDISASSASETVTDLIKSSYENYLDKEIGTCLLAGMICATDNFQSSIVSPKTLSLASYLMERGADQQKIIKALYKTKEIAELRLFGRLLARLKRIEKGFSFAALPYEDFLLTQTSVSRLAPVLEDFREQAPNFNPLILVWENDKKEIWGLALSRDFQKIRIIQEKFGGVVKKDLLFFRPPVTRLNEAESEITKYLA